MGQILRDGVVCTPSVCPPGAPCALPCRTCAAGATPISWIASLAAGLPLSPSLGPPPAPDERPQQLADRGHGVSAPSLTSRAVWCPSFPGPLPSSWGHHANGPGWRWCVCPASVPSEPRHSGPLCYCLWDHFQPGARHRSSENTYVNCCRCKWPGSPKHGMELRFCSDLMGGRFVLQGRVSLRTRGHPRPRWKGVQWGLHAEAGGGGGSGPQRAQVECCRGDLLPSRVPEQR